VVSKRGNNYEARLTISVTSMLLIANTTYASPLVLVWIVASFVEVVGAAAAVVPERGGSSEVHPCISAVFWSKVNVLMSWMNRVSTMFFWWQALTNEGSGV